MGRACRVLLVSYYFPPAGGVSVQRMLSLAKYLPRPGCEVGVLTAWNGAYPVADPALLREVPGSVRIHRAFSPELPYQFRRKVWSRLAGRRARAAVEGGGDAAPSLLDRAKAAAREKVRRTLVPDPQRVWRPFAVRKAAKLIRRYGYDTVLVTAPPYSAFLVGNALKERFPHLTLVSDFRDDWFGFYLGGVDPLASDYKRQRALELERQTVERSDLVVAVTQATRDDIRARYPEQPEEKFAVVPNGYDPKLLPERVARPPRRESMVVSYVGTVYRPCSPRHFLDALERLPGSVRDRIEARFVGRVIDDEARYFEGRRARIRRLGFLPQREALRHLNEADLLLLVVDDPQTLSGKLFEYLASGTPILALTPPGGESAGLVRRANAGWVAPPRDVDAIAQALLEAYRRFEAGTLQVEPAWEEIRRYERPRLAGEYLALLRGERRASWQPASVAAQAR